MLAIPAVLPLLPLPLPIALVMEHGAWHVPADAFCVEHLATHGELVLWNEVRQLRNELATVRRQLEVVLAAAIAAQDDNSYRRLKAIMVSRRQKRLAAAAGG